MKRWTTLLLALVMTLGLFAGCGGKTTTETTEQTARSAEEATASPEAPTSEPGQTGESGTYYNTAAGSYEVGEDGSPLSTYEYQLGSCDLPG